MSELPWQSNSHLFILVLLAQHVSAAVLFLFFLFKLSKMESHTISIFSLVSVNYNNHTAVLVVCLCTV